MCKQYLVLLISTVLTSCLGGETGNLSNEAQTSFHRVIVTEVLQTTNYTYLRVKENDSLLWLAVSKIEAKEGETYYYENPMRMENFESKELNRKFDTVYFIDKVSKQPMNDIAEPISTEAFKDTQLLLTENQKRSLTESHGMRKPEQQGNIHVEPAKGEITIKELYSQKEKYEGKVATVRGKVTKINPGIMNRNWVHIQDGTSAGDKFDLTVTTTSDVKVDDIISFEGKISVNKDFGFGYFYDLIMEDAVQR
jgi:hypothetical protein